MKWVSESSLVTAIVIIILSSDTYPCIIATEFISGVCVDSEVCRCGAALPTCLVHIPMLLCTYLHDPGFRLIYG